MVYAKEGKKATVFDTTFASLGVVFNLSGIKNKRVEITHTTSRREELAAYIEELLGDRRYSPKALERLRGRLLWFENFVCGRQANSYIAQLGEYIGSSKQEMDMDNKLSILLQVVCDRIVSGKPVVITPAINLTWLFFTDGACEEQSSVGGTLIHPNGKPILFFGDIVPDDIVALFCQHSKHPIYEVETLAILVAILLWGAMVEHAQVVFYLDNDASRSGFIRGSGATEAADTMIRSFCQLENALNLRSWFSRVPSHSNLGDDPSRLQDSTLFALGAKKKRIDWQTVTRLLMSSHVDVGMVRGLGSDRFPIAK